MRERTFTCPSCGAPLTAPGDPTEVTCKFCGMTVIVPEEVREPQPPIIEPYQQNTPQVVIVEQQPEIIYTGQPQEVQRPRQRRRRQGGCCSCSCGGCCGPIFLLFILAVAGLGFLSKNYPDVLPKVANQVQAAVGPLMESPRVIWFNVSSRTVSARGLVTVTWASIGDSVELTKTYKGQSDTMRGLPAVGQHNYTMTNESGDVVFRIRAIKNGQADVNTETVTVRPR